LNYARPAVYQSSATLLTFAATAVDQNSGDVDFQHVTIQKQKLLSFELLSAVLSKIKSQGKSNLTLTDIRNMLRVEAIENTNLLEMVANGGEPEILPLVINTWIDVYLDVRALSVKNSAHNTVELVKSELLELDAKIEQTAKELDQFRKEHDISSIVREENELPATLRSLTQALNKAKEELVKSKARLDAINIAIAKNQTVVPKQEQRSLSQLEKRHQELTEKLTEFDRRFTRDHFKFRSSLKVIPEQIKQLEREIREKQKTGKSMVWTEASQNYHAAKQVVSEMRQQLDAYKDKATNFSTLFAKHQKLVADLESFELINRETRERLLKIESKQFEKYPQVDVVERAGVNRQAVSPDYNIGALIVLIISLVLAFLMVWFNDFLMRGKENQSTINFPITAWFGNTEAHQGIAQQSATNEIEQHSQNGLAYLQTYQKLAVDEVQVLLKHADNKTQQLILLLLSGVTLNEISGLTIEQINSDGSMIRLEGTSPRDIQVGERLQVLLIKSTQGGFLWGVQDDVFVVDLNAMLYCCEVDAGLIREAGLLAETLRQTYVIYLVEQGIRLALLDKIIGYQSPLELAGYAEYSPSAGGCEIENIQPIYPACS
ncbi:MAG: integrase, partial [Methylococcales bacterium]|nr:integrase [Methylococcales bacterium]